jgi:protein-S-isoprenylcysteine O-methyltransferase Ste14
MMLARHLLSILILPFMVVVVIPRWLLSARPAGGRGWASDSFLGSVAPVAGGILVLTGFALFAWCVVLFVRVGRGTLAPWDPTKALVAVGPYRHVRNPMITGVATMLAGEALLFGSRSIAIWLAVFALINHLNFLMVEEPGLVRRFGASYEEYRAGVPRWLPRISRRTRTR